MRWKSHLDTGNWIWEAIMSEVWPKTTADERDPQDDQEAEKQREEEIQSDKPPHHDD